MINIDDFIPNLKIESNSDGTVTLESEWTGNVDRVCVHPIHLRYLAEKMGLIAEVSASDADMLRTERRRVADLTRDQRRLRLALLAVRDRTEQLFKALCAVNDLGHEDISVEVAQTAALADIADLACADFEKEFVNIDEEGKPKSNPQQTHRVSSTDGTTATVPKTGPVPKAGPLPTITPQQLDLEAA
jgi:hypothetical protein